MTENVAPGLPKLTARGQETHDRIVKVAAQLMFEHGVAGTSIDHVKAAAGVSGSQMYHYFANKQALVRAVIAYQTDAVLAGQEPLLSSLDSLEALRAWRDLLVLLQRERECRGGCPIGTLGGELSDSDPDARHDLVASFERWERPIRQGLTVMRDRGDLSAEADPDRLALSLLTAVQGGIALTQIRRDPAPLATTLDVLIDHIAGLSTTAGSADRD